MVIPIRKGLRNRLVPAFGMAIKPASRLLKEGDEFIWTREASKNANPLSFLLILHSQPKHIAVSWFHINAIINRLPNYKLFEKASNIGSEIQCLFRVILV